MTNYDDYLEAEIKKYTDFDRYQISEPNDETDYMYLLKEQEEWEMTC